MDAERLGKAPEAALPDGAAQEVLAILRRVLLAPLPHYALNPAAPIAHNKISISARIKRRPEASRQLANRIIRTTLRAPITHRTFILTLKLNSLKTDEVMDDFHRSFKPLHYLPVSSR